MTEKTSSVATPVSLSDSPGDMLDFSRQAGYAATIQFGRLHRMDPRGKEQELIRQVEESVDLLRQTCTIATALDMHGLLEKYHANEAALRDQEETIRDARRRKLAGGQSDFIIKPVHTYRPSHQISRSFSSNSSKAGVGENKMSIELQHQIEAIIRARASTDLVKGETLSHTDYLSEVDKEELKRIRSVVAQSVEEAKTTHQTRLAQLAEDKSLKGKVKKTIEKVGERFARTDEQGKNNQTSDQISQNGTALQENQRQREVEFEGARARADHRADNPAPSRTAQQPSSLSLLRSNMQTPTPNGVGEYSSNPIVQVSQILDDIQGNPDIPDAGPNISSVSPQPIQTPETPPRNLERSHLYSGQEMRNELTAEGAQDWLARFRNQVANLSDEVLPGTAREQLSRIERDFEDIPPQDAASRTAYQIARAEAEKCLSEQGWDVHGPEWQGASASTVSENYHIDALRNVDPDAKVIKIENIGVYPKDPTKPEYAARVLFRNPDGTIRYASIRNKNSAPSSQAMPPAHSFPSNPPSRVVQVVGNVTHGVQNAASSASGYVDRLTDVHIPGAPGVAAGARQAARVATDALGDLTARFRRRSDSQQSAPIPAPLPRPVPTPIPDATPPITPETQPPDPIAEARKRYQQARIDFVGWARDDTNLREIESYFRKLNLVKDNQDREVFPIVEMKRLGTMPPGEKDEDGRYLVAKAWGYLDYLDRKKIGHKLVGHDLEAVNRIRGIIMSKVEDLTGGKFVFPPADSTSSRDRMSANDYDDLRKHGYAIELIGTRPKGPPTEYEVIHYGFYPQEQVLRSDFAIPVRLKYLPDTVQPQPPVPEPVPPAETTVAEAHATLAALENRIPNIIESAQTDFDANYQKLLAQLAAIQKKFEESGPTDKATDIRLLVMLLQQERAKFEVQK